MATLARSRDRDTERIPDSLSHNQTVTRKAQYIGSFSVSVDVLTRKSSSIRDNLSVLKAGYNHGRDILLDISLTGITVTSSQHQAVIMTHPLKMISYATCDPASCLFSFMVRDPTSPLHLQQCHTFRLRTPCQAEELNTIVGTAFRAAYALQMQREGQALRRAGDQRMMTSRSAEDLVSSSHHRKSSSSKSLASTISVKSLVQTDEASRQSVCVTDSINCLDRRQTASPVTLPEYSQVFDTEDQRNMDSMAQDSGISSTSDSTNSYSGGYKLLSINKESHEDLSKAPWYQAEMQRDIAMSVLAKEPLGSFMVRNSETQLGTLALSVRVPSSFHPLGITHYIINMLENGYQIKGFLKVHPSLTALITHHSIMPELLPVPLNIHRHNPSFSDMDHDYASLQDYTQLMRDLRLGQEADYQ